MRRMGYGLQRVHRVVYAFLRRLGIWVMLPVILGRWQMCIRRKKIGEKKFANGVDTICLVPYTYDMSKTKGQEMTYTVSGHNDHIGLYEEIGVVTAKTPRGANQIAKRQWGADKWSEIYLRDQDGNVYEFGK